MAPDRLDDIIRPCEDVVVPEPQDIVTVSVQELRATGIVRQPLRFIVLTAIDLDNELSFQAGKVDDVRSDTMLAAKVTAESVRAKA
jgi:hypothetical protein